MNPRVISLHYSEAIVNMQDVESESTTVVSHSGPNVAHGQRRNRATQASHANSLAVPESRPIAARTAISRHVGGVNGLARPV